MRAKPIRMLRRETRLQFEEIAVIDDLLDQLLHVVGLVRIGRNQRIERRLDAVRRVGAGRDGGARAVRAGQEIDKAAQFDQRLDIVLEGEIGDARSASYG